MLFREGEDRTRHNTNKLKRKGTGPRSDRHQEERTGRRGEELVAGAAEPPASSVFSFKQEITIKQQGPHPAHPHHTKRTHTLTPCEQIHTQPQDRTDKADKELELRIRVARGREGS